MLGLPSAGWSRVKIGNFEEDASYLLDTPLECVEAALNYLKTKSLPLTMRFEAEGPGMYYTVSDDYNTFIFWCESPEEGIQTEVVSAERLINEIYHDVNDNIDAWCGAEWAHNDVKFEQKLRVQIKELGKLLEDSSQANIGQ